MHANNVSYNRIIRSNTVLYDCGSIYTLSAQPGSEISYNYIENQVLLYGSLYHDARSSGFHTHHNVVVGGPMWLYLQWGSLGAVNHITIDNNYHNQTVDGGCANKQYADTCQSTGFCVSPDSTPLAFAYFVCSVTDPPLPCTMHNTSLLSLPTLSCSSFACVLPSLSLSHHTLHCTVCR
jgi:hypothetical protein